MSEIITAADEITTVIRTVNGAECAVLDLVPEMDLDQVRNLQIVVTPQGKTRTNQGGANRATPERTVKVNIAIMKRLQNKNQIPDMLNLAEAVEKSIERRRIGNGIVTHVEMDPIYDTEVFRRCKVFIAVMTANIKGF